MNGETNQITAGHCDYTILTQQTITTRTRSAMSLVALWSPGRVATDNRSVTWLEGWLGTPASYSHARATARPEDSRYPWLREPRALK